MTEQAEITTVECEFCGWSLRYSAPGQIGGDSYHDVRARVCRHERRCLKNPLIKTMIEIRELLRSTRIRPDQIDLAIKIKTAIRKTFDCILDVEVEREKKERERKVDNGKR